MIGALVLLAILAVLSLLVSGMPTRVAWLSAVAVSVYAGLEVRRYMQLPVHAFLFPGNDLPVLLDGESVDAVKLQWRGNLAFLSWQDRGGRQQRLSWWPDTLPSVRRRELRLAAGHPDAARKRSGMAP